MIHEIPKLVRQGYKAQVGQDHAVKGAEEGNGHIADQALGIGQVPENPDQGYDGSGQTQGRGRAVAAAEAWARPGGVAGAEVGVVVLVGVRTGMGPGPVPGFAFGLGLGRVFGGPDNNSLT